MDLTPADVGRDIRFLEAVARQSGLNVIACTGQRFFSPNADGSSAPAIADLAKLDVGKLNAWKLVLKPAA